MVRIFLRAFKRAKIPLRFSQGFHPAPKVSFGAALPVGTESLEEHFMVQVPLYVSRETIVKGVNAELPRGLKITACDTGDLRAAVQTRKRFHYTVTLREAAFSEDNLQGFLEQDTWVFSTRNRKGRTRTMDLKPMIKKISLFSESKAEIVLEEGDGASVRPKDVLDSIFGLSEETLRLATIIKRPAE